MLQTRREWLSCATGAVAAATLGWPTRTPAAESAKPRLRFGMCDWSLGDTTPEVFKLAEQIGLDGIQVSVGNAANRMWLRQSEVQTKYLNAAKAHGQLIGSLALGELNHVPLMSEPRAGVWLSDAIDVAVALKTQVILMAFFSKGELKEENAEDMRRVTELLIELAPKAEKAGVILGIESYLSLEGHLQILDQVKSPAVQVYYDIFNSHVTKGYDFVRDMKTLGKSRICEIHLKEGGNYLGGGKVDWPKVAAVTREIGYEGWIVLETSCPSKDKIADTRRNLDYARKLFAST